MQDLIEQAMQHPLVVNRLNVLRQNLENNPPSDPTATDLILWAKENFIQRAMELSLATPVSPPGMHTSSWKQEWANESEAAFFSAGGEILVEECGNELVAIDSQIPEVVANIWLLHTASAAAQVVRMVSCGLDPELLRD